MTVEEVKKMIKELMDESFSIAYEVGEENPHTKTYFRGRGDGMSHLLTDIEKEERNATII